jgi:hypothetical protein
MPPRVAADKICPHGKSGKNRYYCRECPGNGVCSHGKNKYYCKDCWKKASAEGTKTGNAEQAENVVRTAPACSLHHALSACEGRASWGGLKQQSPPSFLQEPLPASKLPPAPPPSFRPLQLIDAESAPPRAWLALLLHVDEK